LGPRPTLGLHKQNNVVGMVLKVETTVEL